VRIGRTLRLAGCGVGWLLMDSGPGLMVIVLLGLRLLLNHRRGSRVRMLVV
jgi:hypothetical protein